MGWGGGAGVSELFFYYESKFKLKHNFFFFFFSWVGGLRGETRVSDFFFIETPNLKKKFFLEGDGCVWGVGGIGQGEGVGGRDRWMDR